ncbi:MAG: KpsF/GutQ family sugar-phosphate isomerase [candidate division KSB1 bacterium]|nr:KpsF/GutQ family sugar-phosphate isomerase [candidate division KSB1 bacterium]MDZ7365037.1 KpsF/GutQ family sugar-phosphate isomerase [candidate division KSB1 bacterium]MDZ7403432.1 KpsF/GutQ family sugar-phosphate isomerase [candidate division KSB1 bacterium]
MSAILEKAREVIRIEAEAVAALEQRLDASFERAVDLLFDCKGRVIVCGIGKSGIIAQKIAATLSSTGTAAIFLHAAEAAHGDLGMVMPGDVVICISKSGSSEEFYALVPILKRLETPIIAMTGNQHSPLAERADVVLDISVAKEACPHNLAPTASTTAALVMGDALAVALVEKRHFRREDFALRHPAGALGKKLFLRIDDVMYAGNKIATVGENATLDEVILEITRKRFGGTCVLSSDGKLVGIITDGDLRRLLENRRSIDGLVARDIMTREPKTVHLGTLAAQVLEIMEEHDIMQMVIVDAEHRPHGMVHLHDLLKAGIR